MDDHEIVELYWTRSEDAIVQTQRRYERYCRCIAYNLLQNEEDAEECVNDAYIRLWNAIPPHRPEKLSAFLGKIVRNLALDRYDRRTAGKRSGEQTALALDELSECLSDSAIPDPADDLALRDALNAFLRSLPPDTRVIFLRRYWYLCPIKTIAADSGLGESKVKMTLLRTRRRLRTFLEKEGIAL